MFWTALGTVILTAVGVALIWRTLHHTRKAAEAAADAVSEARAATLAAQEAVSVSREMGSRQLRAYVGHVGMMCQNSAGENYVRVMVEFRNSGQTPARRIQMRMGTFIRSPDSPPFFINCSDKEEASFGPTDLDAGQTVTCSINITRENFEIAANAAVSGRGVFVVMISTRYEDVFGTRRRTLVTRFLEPRALSEYRKIFFVAYHKGNRNT